MNTLNHSNDLKDAQLINLISRVLNIEEEKIDDQLSRDTTEEWDSFNHLLLISEIERNMKIRFALSDVEQIKTFKQLKELISKKK